MPQPVPLLSSQLALLHADGTTARNYNNVISARITSRANISPAAFRRAMEVSVLSQAAYRLRFGIMAAWFADPVPSAPVDFLAVGDADDILAPLDDYSFDLHEGPLVCCSYATSGLSVPAFAVSAPHVVLDGAAQEFLLRSIAAACEGKDVTTCDESRYRYHVSEAIKVEERALIQQGHSLDDFVAQWAAERGHFESLTSAIPSERRPDRAVYRIPPELIDAMESSCRHSGASRLDLVLAAYAAWLTSSTGVAKHAIRLIASVRDSTAEPFAGCLINTLPIVLDGQIAPASLIASTIQRKRQALTRRFVPYLDACRRLLACDFKAVEILERSTMVTYRATSDAIGSGSEFLTDVDYTLPPAWPRAPILLRILKSREGMIINVESDPNLPGILRADQIAAGLVSQLADLIVQ